MSRAAAVSRRAVQGLIRGYQLTLSGLVGRHCRHLPSCSDYASEAVGRHGVWAGSWMAAARLCRCGPGGTSGLDFVCERIPDAAGWSTPWRYGRWRGTNPTPPVRDGAQEALAKTSMSRSSPLSTLKSRV